MDRLKWPMLKYIDVQGGQISRRRVQLRILVQSAKSVGHFFSFFLWVFISYRCSFFGHHYFIFGKLVDLLYSLHLNFGVQKQTISISVFMVSIVNFYVIWGYLFNYLKCFTMIINIINGSATNCGPVQWRTLSIYVLVLHLPTAIGNVNGATDNNITHTPPLSWLGNIICLQQKSNNKFN